MHEASFVRLKFFGTVGIGWLSALCIQVVENSTLTYALMVVFLRALYIP